MDMQGYLVRSTLGSQVSQETAAFSFTAKEVFSSVGREVVDLSVVFDGISDVVVASSFASSAKIKVGVEIKIMRKMATKAEIFNFIKQLEFIAPYSIIEF